MSHGSGWYRGYHPSSIVHARRAVISLCCGTAVSSVHAAFFQQRESDHVDIGEALDTAADSDEAGLVSAGTDVTADDGTVLQSGASSQPGVVEDEDTTEEQEEVSQEVENQVLVGEKPTSSSRSSTLTASSQQDVVVSSGPGIDYIQGSTSSAAPEKVTASAGPTKQTAFDTWAFLRESAAKVGVVAQALLSVQTRLEGVKRFADEDALAWDRRKHDLEARNADLRSALAELRIQNRDTQKAKDDYELKTMKLEEAKKRAQAIEEDMKRDEELYQEEMTSLGEQAQVLESRIEEAEALSARLEREEKLRQKKAVVKAKVAVKNKKAEAKAVLATDHERPTAVAAKAEKAGTEEQSLLSLKNHSPNGNVEQPQQQETEEPHQHDVMEMLQHEVDNEEARNFVSHIRKLQSQLAALEKCDASRPQMSPVCQAVQEEVALLQEQLADCRDG
ncbi:unnamed protein product [Amoebophrya sp. A25]|nr:unnamed protein product [Amoebophrya sp. A25]|eukprot:GSA25T00025765001.1